MSGRAHSPTSDRVETNAFSSEVVSFQNQYGISGLLKTLIEALHGTILFYDEVVLIYFSFVAEHCTAVLL